MKVIADLHLHSKYSRAVSQKMDLAEIASWARKKGIDLVATGDWTHPLWIREIKTNLEEDGSGLLGLKGDKRSPRFLLSTEISSIYSQGGKQRRIHNLVLVPSIKTAEEINQALAKRGVNLLSDGRPITGISSRDLVNLVLSIDEKSFIIPCHVWTPWFSLYGSMSGFDSIDECFGEMAKNIFAIETGLSSSPAMNWRIKELDHRAIVSFSDAHSGPKLGREATVFEIPEGRVGYETIRQAMVNQDIRRAGRGDKKIRGSGQDTSEDKHLQGVSPAQSAGAPSTSEVEEDQINRSTTLPPRIAYTTEFYPEEGKYHYTGHRNCNVRQSPQETQKLGATCSVCGKPLTIGVMHRVRQLAAHEIKNEKLKIKSDKNGVRWIGYKERPPYAMLVPLLEILAESLGGSTYSQKIINEYNKLTENFGGEFKVLLNSPVNEIAKIVGPKVSEAIKKVRSGDILVEPGFDGRFGKVKIWAEEKKKEGEKKQLSLF